MAYVTVPKDLTHVKSKVLFGLTKRQLVCFGGALLTGGPLYFLTRDYLSNSAAALVGADGRLHTLALDEGNTSMPSERA